MNAEEMSKMTPEEFAESVSKNATPRQFEFPEPDQMERCTKNERLFLNTLKQNSIYYKETDPLLLDMFDEAEYIQVGYQTLYGRDFPGVDLSEIGGVKTFIPFSRVESTEPDYPMTLRIEDDEDEELYKD